MDIRKAIEVIGAHIQTNSADSSTGGIPSYLGYVRSLG